AIGRLGDFDLRADGVEHQERTVHRNVAGPAGLFVRAHVDQLGEPIEGQAALVAEADGVAFGDAAPFGFGDLNVQRAAFLRELVDLVGDTGDLIVDVAAEIRAAARQPRDVVGQRLACEHGESAHR